MGKENSSIYIRAVHSDGRIERETDEKRFAVIAPGQFAPVGRDPLADDWRDQYRELKEHYPHLFKAQASGQDQPDEQPQRTVMGGSGQSLVRGTILTGAV